MSGQVECYSHIPGLVLDDTQAIALRDGTVQHLSFERWLDAEDPSMAWSEGRYSSTSPVFLVSTVRVDEDVGEVSVDDVRARMLEAARRASYALLLTQWVWLPDPERSAAYLRDQNGSWVRFFGANERELLLVPNPPYVTLAAHELSAFATVCDNLNTANVGAATPELLRLFDIIRLAGQPGCELIDLVIYFVATQEDLINRRGDRPLGATFARRLSAFFASDFDRLDDWQDAFRLMYSARSDALHGKDPAAALDALEGRFSEIGRFLLYACDALCSHLASLAVDARPGGAELAGFVSRLDRAAVDRSEHGRLQADVGHDWLRS
jgi:hypothetical protein